MPDLPLIPAWVISLMAFVSALLMFYKWTDHHWTPFILWFLWKMLPQLYLSALYAFVIIGNLQPEVLSAAARFGIALILLPHNIEAVYCLFTKIKKLWVTGL